MTKYDSKKRRKKKRKNIKKGHFYGHQSSLLYTIVHNNMGRFFNPPPPLGDTTPAILAGTKRTENSFGIIWPSPRQLRVKNTLRVGHRGPVGRKTTQKPPQNTKKWKKIVKKRLFSRFGHFGQNSDFSRKKSKTGIFFDITKPPLAQIYPKSGL